MAKGKDKTTKPAAAKAKAAPAKLQTITNHAVQHRTVCVGPDSIPLPPGATAPFPEKAAAWCKKSAPVQAWIADGSIVIRDVEEDESGDE